MCVTDRFTRATIATVSRRPLAALALAAAASACAGETDICDGARLDLLAPMDEPVTATELSCAGDLAILCSRPVVRLDSSRCESPQVELASADRDDLFLALTLQVGEAGEVEGALAAATAGGETRAVDEGWVQLYRGSLDEPDRLSGEISVEMSGGTALAGRFTALTNP